MEVPCEEHNIGVMVSAIKEVSKLLRTSSFSTFSEVDREVWKILKKYERYGDGFERFHADLLKDAASIAGDLQKTLQDMQRRCERRLRECHRVQKSIVNNVLPFIRSNSKILVHGSGAVLAYAIACSIQEQEGVTFYICQGLPLRESAPHGTGTLLLQKINETREGAALGNDKVLQYCTLIPDSAVGYVLSCVDFVLSGAFAVGEHGGLIHDTGALQLATMAHIQRVPFYVLCETFKFTRLFPLSTEDLKQPQEQIDMNNIKAYVNTTISSINESSNNNNSSSNTTTTTTTTTTTNITNGSNNTKKITIPLVEFVPPSYVTLIFSEKGIMPPAAVADEMFRFHTASQAPWKRNNNNNNNNNNIANSNNSNNSSNKTTDNTKMKDVSVKDYDVGKSNTKKKVNR